MTNADVIALSKAGLGSQVIIGKIESSATKFDTGTDAIVTLKAAGVPDDVILALVRASARGGQSDTGRAPSANEAAGVVAGKMSEQEFMSSLITIVIPDAGSSVWLFSAGSFCTALDDFRTPDGRAGIAGYVRATSEGVAIAGTVPAVKPSFFHKTDPWTLFGFLPIRQTVSGPDGSFTIANVSPGDYDLAIQENVGFTYNQLTNQPSGGGGGGAYCKRITVDAGKTLEISGVLNSPEWPVH